MSRLLSLIGEHKLLTALITGTVAADVAYYGLHNVGQSFRSYRVSCTKQGSTEMLPASEELREILRSAGDKLGVAATGLDHKLQPFVCRGIDPVRRGRLSMAGTLRPFLGLPEYFGYKAADGEQRHSFCFEERPLSLNTKKGKQLYRDCLLLTDDEKGFAMARELAYLTSYAAHVPPIMGTVASTGFIGTLYWLNYGKGKSFVQSLMGRSGSLGRSLKQILLVVSAGGLWSVMAYQWYAAYCKSLDARVDRRAAAAFPLGAVSFYQKQVKRNTLLRAMLGDSIGKKYFTVKGNEASGWVLSDPFLPVNQRWSKLRYDQSLAAREASAAAS